MVKLTKELRDRCVTALREAPVTHWRDRSTLADALAACEVEEEPVMWDAVREAAEADGWNWIFDGEDVQHLFRGDRHFYVVVDQDDQTVTTCEHCPPDLLGGRLKALEVADG